MWLEQGPDSTKTLEKSAANANNFRAKFETSERSIDGICTLVSNQTLNSVLKNILMLIHNNLGTEEASWMKRIAGDLQLNNFLVTDFATARFALNITLWKTFTLPQYTNLKALL